MTPARMAVATDLTHTSTMNHNYVRRVQDSHRDFAAFWADGNPDNFSRSHLYFTNADGTKVWQLPYEMNADFAEPRLIASQ